MQGWYYGKGLIYYRPIFRLTKLAFLKARARGGSRIFSRRGCTRLLLYFNANKPHRFFFLQNTSCIRKPQVISGGGGGAHPLHPHPRSAPESYSALFYFTL